MIALQETYPYFTPTEYLEWEEQQKLRYEYVNGEVYAMTGGTVNHGEISTNFSTILKNQLRGSGCRVLNSDVKVASQKSNTFLYPDISVTCDAEDHAAQKFISKPCLIVEVLSPSTEAYDRGDKFRLYRRSTALQEYILVNSNEICVEIYQRNERDRWELISYGAGDLIELPSISFSFPIEQIYEEIIFTI